MDLKNKERIIIGIAAGLLSLLMFCGNNRVPMEEKIEIKSNRLSQQQLDFLASKMIYFGHQSVGFNIIEGMKTVIHGNPKIRLHILETDKADGIGVPVFVHSTIGANGDPESKIDAFSNNIMKGVGEKANIAFMKLCYVDILQSTDTIKIFGYYKDRMIQLQKKFPHITLLHFTVPLTTLKVVSFKSRAKDLIKRIIGRITEEERNREDNLARQRFNEMMRKEYPADILFDIAKIESTLPGGERETGIFNGEKYFALPSRYTTDGGHLNRLGQLVAGDALIAFLAGVSSGIRR